MVAVSEPIESTDVVVIGGGPAGATAATLIAKGGYRVHLYERERFPRYHIGESLIPRTYDTFARLGILDELKQSGFIKKYSVQFITHQGKLSEPFYFSDYLPHESSQTWQVTRADFDCMMLNNSRRQGASVYEGVRVLNVLFEGPRAVGVRIQAEDGSEREVRSKVVVDASGMSSMLIDRLNLRQWDPDLKKAAIWSYWRGARRDTGRDEGATLVMQTHGKMGWFWYIPLQDDIVSVGVVAGFDYLFKERATKELGAIYFEEVARCPGLQPRLVGAEQVGPFRAAKEYSYKARQCAGDGWVLVGDAFGFLDPLYSSGVLLALKSGELAADAILDGLARNDTSEAQLRRWEANYLKGMDRMRRLVCAFYEGFSFGKFVMRYPHLKNRITDLLMGDMFEDKFDEVWAGMDAIRQETEAAVTV